MMEILLIDVNHSQFNRLRCHKQIDKKMKMTR